MHENLLKAVKKSLYKNVEQNEICIVDLFYSKIYKGKANILLCKDFFKITFFENFLITAKCMFLIEKKIVFQICDSSRFCFL